MRPETKLGAAWKVYRAGDSALADQGTGAAFGRIHALRAQWMARYLARGVEIARARGCGAAAASLATAQRETVTVRWPKKCVMLGVSLGT